MDGRKTQKYFFHHGNCFHAKVPPFRKEELKPIV